ncbi:DUF5060 domain-containing protein [Gimesia panareensis]|uniref:DUF5060 domain-containing protein n=1 Tax=Gimesia panareensis TaxID=2527978 RepID=UPI00118CF0B1|nr:DUF5060 domain-containing protein [Gimesia panareensis]QDU47899.1 hypothetical protein Pan110_02090 [Gimesia panareensis]
MKHAMLLIVFVCLFVVRPVSGQEQQTQNLLNNQSAVTSINDRSATITGERKKWHKITFSWAGPMTSETADPNPFTDYRLNVIFTHTETGKHYQVPGYYAADGNAAETSASSGRVWRAHFAPSETGTWSYVVSFRTGPDIAVDNRDDAGSGTGYFDGDSGTFDVADTDKTGRDLRGQGLLEYAGGHYLRFAETGKYFLKQGADAPENLLAYRDFDGEFKEDGIKDNLIKTWKSHLRDWNPGDPMWQGGKGKGLIGAVNYLASEGLNAFSFLTMNINGDDRNVFPYLKYNGQTSPQDDRLRIDCSRMDQWGIVFDHGTKMGMFLHFKTQERENQTLLDDNTDAQLSVERRLYYRELIARFGHNLALNWNLGEEIDTPKSPTQLKIAWAQYIHDTDPYHHPIVIHNGSNHFDLIGKDSPLTGFSLQTNRPDFSQVHNRIKTYLKKSAQAGRPWVVACDEPGDASHALRPDNDAGKSHIDGRKNGIWGTLLAGGCGNEWYFGYRHSQSDLTCEDWRSRDVWWDYCRYALQFFEESEIPFWEMASNDSLTTAADDYCFFKKGKAYVVYLKDGGTTDLNLQNVAGKYELKWYDPRHGGKLLDGSIKTISGGGSRNLGQAPDTINGDWVILIRKVSE